MTVFIDSIVFIQVQASYDGSVMGQHKSKSAHGSLNSQANGTHKPKKANKKLSEEDLDELEIKTYCGFCSIYMVIIEFSQSEGTAKVVQRFYKRLSL